MIGTPFTSDQIALKIHIQDQNDKLRLWVEEAPPGVRWAGMVCDDPTYWAGLGIFSIEQYDFYMELSEYTDAHKAIVGFRPDCSHLKTLADVRTAMNALL